MFYPGYDPRSLLRDLLPQLSPGSSVGDLPIRDRGLPLNPRSVVAVSFLGHLAVDSPRTSSILKQKYEFHSAGIRFLMVALLNCKIKYIPDRPHICTHELKMELQLDSFTENASL